MTPIRVAFFLLLFIGCVHADSTNSSAHAAPATNAVPATTTAPATTASNPGTLPDDVQKALQLPDEKARHGAMAAAGLAWEKKDPRAALTWALALPKDDGNFVIRGMANDWGSREPVPAKDWVMGQSQPIQNGSNALLAYHLIVTAWARQDQPAAIDFAAKQPVNTDLRTTAYYSVADGWAQKDPAAACAWAATLPAESDRHTAFRVAVPKWTQREVAAAWAEKLPAADLKAAAPLLVGGWAKTDAAKAKAWVNGLPLSDADKAEILAKIK